MQNVVDFWATFVKRSELYYRTVVLSVLSCLSVCLSVTLVYCGKTVGRIKMKLGMQVGLASATLREMGIQLAARGTTPNFRPISVIPYIRCGQTAGWIKMPLRMEVGVGPGDFLLDGDPAPSKRGTTLPLILGPCLLRPNGWTHHDTTWYGLSILTVCLSVCCVYDVGVLWPNGWMDQDETWHAGRRLPGPHCVRWGPSSPIFGPCPLWPNGWMD